MNIVKKLIIVISIFSLSLVLVGGFGLSALHASKQSLDNLADDFIPSINVIENAIQQRDTIKSDLLLAFINDDPKARDTYLDKVEADFALLQKSLDLYQETLLTNDDDKALSVNDKQLSDVYHAAVKKFIADHQVNGQSANAQAYGENGSVIVPGNDLSSALIKHLKFNVDLANTTQNKNTADYQQTFYVLLTLICGALFAAGFIALLVIRYVKSSLNDFGNKLQIINQSLDLTQIADEGHQDEIGHTAKNFNALITRFNDILLNVHKSSESVAVASREIAAANIELSARTEQQSAALEQTAASMNELSATVTQNVDNTRQANILSKQANDTVDLSSMTVEKMLKTMNEISAGSTKISEITGIIESIAFQTN